MTHMDTDDPIGRRREKRARQARTRLLVFGALAGVGLAGAAATVAALVVTGKTGVVAVDRPAWTHKELAEHLKAKGVPVVTHAIPGVPAPGQVAADFAEGADWERGAVRVFLGDTPRAARETAGARGGQAFAWGRFAVCSLGSPGADRLYARIRAALD